MLAACRHGEAYQANMLGAKAHERERERGRQARENKVNNRAREWCTNVGRDDLGVLVAEVAEHSEAVFVERVGGAQQGRLVVQGLAIEGHEARRQVPGGTRQGEKAKR